MSRAMCECAATGVQEKWTLDEFVRLQRALAAGVATYDEKRQIADISLSCVPKKS